MPRQNRVSNLALVLALGAAALIAIGCEKRQARSATSQPAAAGGPPRVVFIPKSRGIAYYEKMYPQFEAACKEAGGEFAVVGPATTDATSQIPIIKDQVQQGVRVILIAPNSVDALNPELEAARSRGVKIISVNQEMPGNESHRDACVLPCDFDEVGPSQVELLGSLMNYEGKFAILSATTNATDQNDWIAGMKEKLKDPKYAKMQLIPEIAYGDDQPEKARKEADSLLTKYSDLRAILAPTSVGLEQTAKAVQARGIYPGGANASSAGGGNGIIVTGLGNPNLMRGYVKDGVVQKFALWDPPREAYVAGHLAVGLAKGSITLGEGKSFEVPKLGSFTFRKNNVVITGGPLVFTKDNIGHYDF
jgi:rhamnose transport system substrate-binding protein